jgi:hypothetical protein
MTTTLNLAREELRDFIAAAKEGGVADDSIVAVLRHRGWPQARILDAIASFYTGALGITPPAWSQPGENARDAFLYLLNFISLGFWVVALGQIGYVMIAHWFPDPAAPITYFQSLRDELSGKLATVIVAFPVFVGVHALIARELRNRRDLYDSGVRKWLTYIALVLATLVVLADGIWFVTALLQGQLTIRFALDSLVLLVLGGGVFTYYLATIGTPKESRGGE